MDDVYLHKVDMPGWAQGVTVIQNGDYIVFINANLSESEQNRAIKHELRHIRFNHFYDDCINLIDCEKTACGG